MIVFFKLENKNTSLNKLVFFLTRSLPSSNKIEILSKSSKNTNQASSMCNPKPRIQHTISLVCDVIYDLRFFKAISKCCRQFHIHSLAYYALNDCFWINERGNCKQFVGYKVENSEKNFKSLSRLPCSYKREPGRHI